jgi:hypothetical protein
VADSGNPEDLVSKVTVTGTEESLAKLDAYATGGAKAFDKLDQAAKKSADDIKKSSSDVERAAADAAKGLEQLGGTKFNLGAASADLGLVERGARNLVTAVRSGIPALASFVTRLTTAGAGAVAAGVAILKLASSVAKASSSQSNALDDQTQAQIAANNSQLAGVQGAIQYEESQRKLQQQLSAGQITYSDYSKALTQLRTDYTDQIRVAGQLEAAQESVRLENERLTKQAADKKAFDALIDTWGGPMLTALRALGNTADRVFSQFQQAFGPAAAKGLDLITGALDKNSGAIGKFFDDASKKLSGFISKNGPAIQKAFETIGTAISSVFDGIISAGPGLLAFFNDSLVPAVTAFGAVLNTIAATINAIFGTQLTGGAIVFLVILGQMTGAFVALINVVRIFAAVIAIIAGLPFGAIFLAVVAVIGILLFLFPQLRQVALNALNSIIATFQGMAAGAATAVQRVVAFFSLLLQFFGNLPGQIVAFFSALWSNIVAGVVSAVQQIIASFNSFVSFVQELPAQIAGFFTEMGAQVVASVSGWVSQVIGFFSNMLAQAKVLLQPIIDLLKTIGALSAAASTPGGSGAVTAAEGGHIRGPGTTTSDSIPAWLSNNEFVMRAKAVAKYGAGFMHAVNSGTFKMPRFNTGGLVSAMMPSMPRLGFADGGEVLSKSMQPLNLNLFGEEFSGLMAPEDVGARLTKFAVSRQNKSAGRKPAWVGRGRN